MHHAHKHTAVSVDEIIHRVSSLMSLMFVMFEGGDEHMDSSHSERRQRFFILRKNRDHA